MKHQQSKLHSKKTSNILHDYRNNLADECNMVEEYDVTLCMKRPPPPCTSNAGSSLSLSPPKQTSSTVWSSPCHRCACSTCWRSPSSCGTACRSRRPRSLRLRCHRQHPR